MAVLALLLGLSGAWFGRAALLYATDRGELELLPQEGLVSVIVLKNDEGVFNDDKLHPLVTDWLDMKTSHTLTVPPGKYQLNAGAWPAGTRIIHWEVTTSNPFGSRRLLIPGEGGMGWSALVPVGRGERVTVRPVIRHDEPAKPDAPTPAEAAWQPLFNGKDLTGWEGDASVWSWQGDKLVGSTFLAGDITKEFRLWSPKSYRDFELKFQARLDTNLGIAGVIVRGQAGFHLESKHLGSFYSQFDTPKYRTPAKNQEELEKTLKLGLNDFHVRCVGKRVMLSINGVTTIDDEFEGIPNEGRLAAFTVINANIVKSNLILSNIQIRELPPSRSPSSAGPGPVTLRSFTPGKDPLPLPLRGPATAVTVVGDAWRIENKFPQQTSGNFNMMVSQALDNLPKDGVLVFRAKVKVEAEDKKAWGDLNFGGANEVFVSWDQWPAARSRYDGNDSGWTEKEARYPAAEIHKRTPPVYLNAGLHANGVFWLKDVELLHLPAPPVPATAPPPANAPFDAKKAKELQEAWARYLGVDVEKTNTIGLKLRLIPPGEFTIGSDKEEIDWLLKNVLEFRQAPDWLQEKVRDEGSGRRVTIGEPFWFGVNEVTVGQFREFVRATKYKTIAERNGGGRVWSVEKNTWEQKPEYVWDHSGLSPRDAYPVRLVSLDDARAFCNWLSEKEGRRYVIPTEEQWECACRAGTETRWFFGDDPEQAKKYGWTMPHFDGPARPVGRLAANPFGLFDVCGNVSEMTVSTQG